MTPLSFRTKITLLSSTVSAGVLITFAVSTYFYISEQKYHRLDTEIKSIATRCPRWINMNHDYQRFEDSLNFIFANNLSNQPIFAVLHPNDRNPLYTSPSWPKEIDLSQINTTLDQDPSLTTTSNACLTPPPEAPAPLNGRGWGGSGRGLGPGSQIHFTKIPKFLSVHTQLETWRIGILGSNDTTLIIGLNTATTQTELEKLRLTFLLALPIALSLVAIGGWLVATRALRPLLSITHTAERITAHGLNQRIPKSNDPSEISRLILVLNRMMDRLETSFHQANRFSADASHELKTPLAIMQGELENAIQDTNDPTQQQFLNGLLEEIQRLKTITSGLLLLSRADSGQLHLSKESVNLSNLLSEIIQDLDVLTDSNNLTFTADIPPNITMSADPTLLRMALLNLFSNAVKYNEPQGKITIQLQPAPDGINLSIGNTGVGIPQEHHRKLFTRFHRIDPARQRNTDGVGLGLSLAKEMIRAHHGDLTLHESQPGWTCFHIHLPHHSSPPAS